MSCIYKITNQINQKVYIGQTRFQLNERWQQHLTASKIGNTKLYQAMREFGINNFIIEKIEDCETNKLNEREIYWISYYNSMLNGYNMTVGGSGLSIINHQKVLELWNEGLNISEISFILNNSNRHISNHLKAEGITNEEIQKRGQEKTIKKRQKGINQYDFQGNLLYHYNSIFEAEKITGINSSHISSTCKHNNYSSNGYIWLYDDDNSIIEMVKKNNEKQIGGKRTEKKVGQYDLNDNLLNTFKTLTEAAKYVNGNKANICRVCLGQQKTSYGFKWRYLE